MADKDDKITRAAHIKRHTAGTSNEISFSVLDAAKNQVEGEKVNPKPVKGFRLGGISLFTLRKKKGVATPEKPRGLPLSTGEFSSSDTADKTGSGTPGVASISANGTGSHALNSSFGMKKEKRGKKTSTDTPTLKTALSPEQEIGQRKTRRRRKRTIAMTLTILLSVTLLGAGGWYLYQDRQAHLSQLDILYSAIDQVKHVDETVMELDEIVEDPFASGALSNANIVLKNLPEVSEELANAQATALHVTGSLRGAEDKEAASQTQAAAKSRQALIESGEQIVMSAQEADGIAKEIRIVWQEVIDGDALAREAATLVVDTTDEKVTQSKEINEQAHAVFTTALDAFNELAYLNSGLDVALYQDYLSKRIEAMGYAMASDEAVLAKNKEDAIASNDAYNEADAQAVEIARTLPDDITKPAYDRYEQATQEYKTQYSTARSQAELADAFLRDYLGTTSK